MPLHTFVAPRLKYKVFISIPSAVKQRWEGEFESPGLLRSAEGAFDLFKVVN